jgi:quercetin dioxygenase-like cupin family protein
MFKKTKSNGHTEVIEGVHLKTLVFGDQTLMVEVKFDKDAVIPTHGHPHEQTGYLISGQLEFVINGENIIVNPGDSWNIPGDVEHSATATDETVVIEVFSPVREDYLPYYSTEE